MKLHKLSCLTLSAFLLAAAPMVWADGHGNGHGRGHHDSGYHGGDYYGRYHEHPGRGHHWRRGEPLPVRYRRVDYVVYDYRHYGLPRPARGHHWVRVDNDFLLTAIATGVILAIIEAR